MRAVSKVFGLVFRPPIDGVESTNMLVLFGNLLATVKGTFHIFSYKVFGNTVSELFRVSEVL